MLDFDNDGWLDIYEANGRVGRQSERYSARSVRRAQSAVPRRRAVRGSRRCSRAAARAAPLIATSRAAAFGDIDNDGAIDIVVVNRDAGPYVLRNVAPQRGHWIMFRVVDAHGRDALGAIVTLTVGGKTVHARRARRIQLSREQRPARARRPRRSRRVCRT